MTQRAFASTLLALVLAACGGDGKITAPQVPTKLTALAAIGTDSSSGATIETNLDDYLPGEVVHLAGRGWAPNETVHLFMTEDPDTHEDVSQDVQADSAGAFSLHFYDVQPHDLGVTFTLTATGQMSGSVATVVFTDGRAISSVTVNGFSTVTVPPNTSISAAVQGALTGAANNTLGSIGLTVYPDGTTPASAVASLCFDVNPNLGPVVPPASIAFSHTFVFNAPSTPDDYDVRATSYSDNGCGVTTGAASYTLEQGIVVQSNTAPTLTPIGGKSVNEGSTLNFTATATDSESPPQTLTFSLDGAPAGATINPTTGEFSWTPTDGPSQTATFTVKVTDTGSPPLSDEEEITVQVDNLPPTITSLLAPASVNESDDILFSVNGITDPSSVDQGGPFTYAFSCGAVTPSSFSGTNSGSCPTSDDGVVTINARVRDKDGGESATYSQTVAVLNVAPNITGMTLPPGPVAVGNIVSVSWTFDDPGADTWECKISWDQPVSFGSLFASSGKTCTASSTTLPAGVYTVTVYVRDDDGGEDQETATAYIVVYDPNGGFVTGGGWINSPAGAYRADLDLTGKATFGFVSKYQKGATTPVGNTEFQFLAGGLNFKSSSYEWLVVAGTKAQYKGEGTVNGLAGFGFLLTAIDNGNSGDKFRIKIWNKATDTIVYDNQPGEGEDSDAATTLSGGSIVVHTKK